MDSGQLELSQVFEEVTRRNVIAITAYTKDTRKIVRELEKEVKKQNDTIRLYDVKFVEMKKQLVVLQTKLFSGGS